MLNSHHRLIDLRRFCALSSGFVLWLGAMSATPAATRKTPAKKAPSHPAKKTPSHPAVPALPTLSEAPPVTPIAPPPPRPATPPAQTSDVATLYQGFSPEEAGITISPIGAGDGADNSDYALQNHHSILVKTVDYYQGARITFTKPAVLAASSNGTENLLLVRLRFAAAASNALAPNAPKLAPHLASASGTGQARFRLAQGPPPGFPGGPPPGFPGGPPGGFPPGFDPTTGQPITPGINNGSAPETFPLKTLRLVFTLANGASFDILRTLPQPSEIPGGNTSSWVNVSVPLSVLKFPAGSETSPLQSISLGADTNGTFYIGQIKVVQDSTPITCFAGDQQDVARNDVVALHATADGGASMLHYSWDFDASNGITEEASTPEVTTQYIKGNQDYKVTLTVSDVDGIKKPATSIVTVKVED